MSKITYKTNKDDLFNQTFITKIDENGAEWSIPLDENNSDYQRYLNPEAEQSTPIVINEASTI
jgi:hypothetical protein